MTVNFDPPAETGFHSPISLAACTLAVAFEILNRSLVFFRCGPRLESAQIATLSRSVFLPRIKSILA